jgi:hypothetical protein
VTKWILRNPFVAADYAVSTGRHPGKVTMKTISGLMARMAAMLVLGAACAASATIGNPEVRVRVQDPKGGMIAKAFVVMHHEWNEHGNEGVEEHRQDEMIRVQFDGTADFVITVKPGIYDVYVSSVGYDPKCMKMDVEYGKDRALVFQLVQNKWIYTPMVE